MAHQVICFGEILWDCFKDGKRAGGAPMNVALHLHKQGINSTLISAVGADKDGEDLLNYLKENGLDPGFIQIRNDSPTGTVEVHIDERNQATYTIVEPVAWDKIEYDKKFDSAIENADAIVFGSLATRQETSKGTLFRLVEKAALKIFDMNIRPPHIDKKVLINLLNLTDILKINEHELLILAEYHGLYSTDEQELLMSLSEQYPFKAICLTLGERGAMVWHDGRTYAHGGFQIKVADTVGAGDAFLAAFTKGILEKAPIEQVLERACATGALVASHFGANPTYTNADIQQYCQGLK